MIGDVTWKINGIDLDTSLGGRLTAATVIRPDVTIRANEAILPGAHGVVSLGLPTYDAPQVILAMEFSANTQSALEEKVNQARALLSQPTLTLTRVSGNISSSAVVTLMSITSSDFLVNNTETLVVTYKVPGVFFRGPVVTSGEISFAANLTNAEATDLSGSTAPIVDATFRISGPLSAVTISDPQTGTSLRWTGTATMPNGTYLYLCPRPLSARMIANSNAWLTGGTSVLGQVDYAPAGRLQLWPVVQSGTTRKVLYTATGSGRVSGQTKLTIRGRKSYL